MYESKVPQTWLDHLKRKSVNNYGEPERAPPNVTVIQINVFQHRRRYSRHSNLNAMPPLICYARITKSCSCNGDTVIVDRTTAELDYGEGEKTKYIIDSNNI